MINRELIEQYFADQENGLQHLVTLFEAITSQRDHAEALVNGHLHTIKKLSEAFSNITEPKTGKKLSETPGRTMNMANQPLTDVRTMNKTTPKQQQPKSKETLDLDL